MPTLSFTPAGQWQRNERNELPLAGYLLAREIDGRPVDDLERLRSANDTVLQTRELLRFGRGNVKSDIEATDSESSARLRLGRAIAKERPHSAYTPLGRADAAAAAIFTGAGSCGEHAGVAVHLHATKLSEPGDLLLRASSRMADHAWGQLQSLPRGNDDAIVMDTWAEGPAVHASDSHYAHDPKSFESPWLLDRASGTDMVARIPGIMESMSKDASKRLAAYLESSKANPLSGENLFDPEPVIHAAFSERVKRKMAEPVVVDEALAQQATGKPSVPKGLFSKIKRALSDPFRKKAKAKERFAARQVEVRNDIKAIGVARSLGRATTVKEAVRQAPEIVDAARNLQQAHRTDQVREFLQARQESSRQ